LNHTFHKLNYFNHEKSRFIQPLLHLARNLWLASIGRLKPIFIYCLGRDLHDRHGLCLQGLQIKKIMEKTLDEKLRDWQPIFYEKKFNEQIDKSSDIYILNRNQITLDLMKVTGRHFVYVLKKNENVIYVGRSSNLYSRLVSHKSKKDFDVIMLYEYTDKGQCRDCEYFAIKHYKPFLNKVWVTIGLNKYDSI